ncbi:MAG: hypothetical protein O8C66_10445 [Candidatus Methanoperedens sp.]|nr:hypothetical protein [Candidatus Methanoperedens sp.]MCZ7370916.1 hypothetical protein [Candidatus Methanoperedens sp.]
MIGGIIAGFAFDGIVRDVVWPESQQLYVVSIPTNISVGKITSVTFFTFGNDATASNANITLDDSGNARGITDSEGMLSLLVNASTRGVINVTAEKKGFRNATSYITATPGLVISASPASITSGTATYVTFSITSIGRPVDEAEVNISGAGVSLDGLTNSNGQIIHQINAPNTGQIVAAARKAGYAEGSTTLSSTSQQTLSVSASQGSVTIGVPAFVMFTITAGGSPVVDARVSLGGPASGSGITNQDGKVIIQFTPQSSGTITVSATATGYASGSTTITSAGTQSLSISPSPASITAGFQTYVQFTVTSGSNLISEANVTLSGAASGNGVTNQNGQVILMVNSTSSGTITASVSKTGYSGASTQISATGQQTLSVSAAPSNITNGVPTYVTFTVMSGSSAISGASVSVSGGGIGMDGMTNSAGQVTLLLNAASTGTINVAARKAGYVDGLTTLAH